MCLGYKTYTLWIQGHYMLKDSTQNHFKWHKTQLVFPACPWLNFFQGAERAFCSSTYMKTYNWVNCLTWSSSPFPICGHHHFLCVLLTVLPFSICTETDRQFCFILCLTAWGILFLYKFWHSVKMQEEQQNGKSVPWCMLQMLDTRRWRVVKLRINTPVEGHLFKG